MRYSLSFCALLAFLLLNSCAKDLSCYRDMIIGTWVEQTSDGQILETDLRSIYTYDRSNVLTIKRVAVNEDGSRTITNSEFSFLITCKIISTAGYYLDGDQEHIIFRDEEIRRFTDSLLLVKVIEERIDDYLVVPTVQETQFKKVSKANDNANTIQNLWEMTQSSNPAAPPFQIRFNGDGSYTLFLMGEEEEEGGENGEGDEEGDEGGEEEESQGNEVDAEPKEVWREKSDESGQYEVYDSFLITSFFNNPIFGAEGKNDVACWEIRFTEVEKEDQTGEEEEKEKVKEYVMNWVAIVHQNGQQVEKSFTFSSVVLPEEER